MELRTVHRRSAAAVILLALAFQPAVPPGAVFAADCFDYNESIQLLSTTSTGGDAAVLALAGSLACIGYWSGGFDVMDVSDPRAPALRGHIDASSIGFAGGIAMRGQYAYVLGEAFHVIDISDPAAPAIVTARNWSGFQLVLAGDLAYLAAGSRGLLIIDISDPAAPELVGEVNTPGLAHGVAVGASHAYVADSSAGLEVIDIANPRAPALVAGITWEGAANDIVLDGELLYVAGTAGLRIYSAAVPEAPALSGLLAVPGGIRAVAVAAGVACATDGDGLQAIDVSVPEAPAALGSIDWPGISWDVALDTGLAFVAAGRDAGLVVYDVTHPFSPDPFGALPTGGYTRGVTMAGDLLYIADGYHGLQIADLGNAAAPELLGGLDTLGEAWEVAISGAYAYVADGSGGLVIMQVGDPRAPIRRGQVDTPGEAYGVAVSGAYAYVADYDHGLHVVDISDPEAPSIVATVLPGGYAMGVTIDAQLAYVAAYHGGLVIIDIADPLSPEIRGRYDRLADDLRFRDVAVQGQRAYAAGFTFERGGLLSVIDVADPAAPFLLGEVVTGTSGTGVAVWEQHAYCAAVGLAVVDVSIPDSPRLLGRVGDEASGDVALAASCIVLADPDSGIRTYPLQCAGPNAVALASFSAAATPVGLLLSWVTGWENDHAGFHVERAAEGTADYDRLTRTLITPPGPYRFLDAGVAPGSTWNYRLVAVSLSGESTVHGPITATAGPMSSARGGLRLAAHPNPWPASRNLEIVYEAGPPAPIQLRIFDPAGRLVRALSVQTSERGAQSLHWDGRDASGRIIPAGVYFLELEAAGQRITSKLARVQ